MSDYTESKDPHAADSLLKLHMAQKKKKIINSVIFIQIKCTQMSENITK